MIPLPIKQHNNNFCPQCQEIILYSSIIRHDSFSKPVEQIIYGHYCPLCGYALVPISYEEES